MLFCWDQFEEIQGHIADPTVHITQRSTIPLKFILLCFHWKPLGKNFAVETRNDFNVLSWARRRWPQRHILFLRIDPLVSPRKRQQPLAKDLCWRWFLSSTHDSSEKTNTTTRSRNITWLADKWPKLRANPPNFEYMALRQCLQCGSRSYALVLPMSRHSKLCSSCKIMVLKQWTLQTMNIPNM